MAGRALPFAALLACAAVGSCRPREVGPDERASLAPEVRVEAVARGEVRPRVPIAGVLAPLPGRVVKVGALVSGYVDRLLVAEGDRVEAGQAVAHVEVRPLRDRLVEAQAQIARARAQLDNATAKLARLERLEKQGIASRQEVDDARNELSAARATLSQAGAGTGTAQLQVERATLRAPIAGVVSAILVPAGQPVDGSGTPVIEIADTTVLDLRAPVAAPRAGAIAVGQVARITVEGEGGASTTAGRVEAIAPLADAATDTVTVRVRVDNADGRLRAGLFARGEILGAPRENLIVPRSALLPGDGGAADSVAVVGAGSEVSHRALSLGETDGARVEVRAGLSPGDRVIVEGGYALPDGTKVRVLAGAASDGGAAR